MRAELEELNSQLGSMSGEEKDLLIRRLLEENAEMKADYEEVVNEIKKVGTEESPLKIKD